MTEADGLGKAVIQAEKILNSRLVELTEGEGKGLLEYLCTRLETPVVGLSPIGSRFKVTNLDEHPFGSLIMRLTMMLGNGSTNKMMIGFSQHDFELLTEDINGQLEIGDLRVLDRAKASLKSVKDKWEGAVG